MPDNQRELVNRTRISSTLDNEIHEKFEELYNVKLKKRINKSRLYDEAIELLLEKYDIEFSKDS